jgi:hypothetical protein
MKKIENEVYIDRLVTRQNWSTSAIYVNPDGSTFVTPDGVGAYFYDTLEEALAQHEGFGWNRIAYLSKPADLESWA